MAAKPLDTKGFRINLDGEPAAAAAPAVRPNLKTPADKLDEIRQSGEVIRRQARAAGAGIVTTRHVAPPAKPSGRRRGKYIEFPAEVLSQVEQDAHHEGVPVRVVILRGLQMLGYDIPEEELTDRRGEFLRRVARMMREEEEG